MSRVSASIPAWLARGRTGAAFAILVWLALAFSTSATPQQTNILGPPGSVRFGKPTSLPNGNIVVVDSEFNNNEGAVYLYHGLTGGLISTLRGGNWSDSIGDGGIVVLANGNYVIISPKWNSPTGSVAGAVTFGNANTGVSGVVSSSNSLIGEITGDEVGSRGVVALANGNYVVRSPSKKLSAILPGIGAVTWGNGVTGTSGVVSAANSLVGSTAFDQVGYDPVTALTNGNYVVVTSGWDNPVGSVVNAGAVTFCNGTTGRAGTITPSNSLVGSIAQNNVGSLGVTALTNGNYVVRSPSWDNPSPLKANVGAVTWGNGTTGTFGIVTSTNSIIGGTAEDTIGSDGVTALANGNYVVVSTLWDNPAGPIVDAGAATFGNGATGVSGVVSASNSLVGSRRTGDRVGLGGVILLTNGHYVVSSPEWTDGGVGAGAVTWCNGTTGRFGPVTNQNSLKGTHADYVGGGGVIALSNGNYVVCSPNWDGMAPDVGAVTWADGAVGITGSVTSANSITGGTFLDGVCSGGITALSNGNYVFSSPYWDHPVGPIGSAGAATWCNGTGPTTGLVTPSNSLVGGAVSDHVGYDGVTALTNGNYVVSSSTWQNGILGPVGAMTFGNGATGTVGAVSSVNSLVGDYEFSRIGEDDEVVPLPNGNYLIGISDWRNGPIQNAGAVVFGNGVTGTSGLISGTNSLVGSVAGDSVGSGGIGAVNSDDYVVVSPRAISYTNGSERLTGTITPANSVIGGRDYSYNAFYRQLVVGRPSHNIVTVVHRTAGCPYAVSPSSVNVAASGGSGQFSLDTIPGCYWTATTNDAWISVVSGSPGNGDGAVAYSVQSTSGPGRVGTIIVGGQTFTINQSGAPSPTPTPTPTPTLTPTPVTPTPTPSPSASPTPLYTRGDYDGDNKTDLTVWRSTAFAPNLSAFYTFRSSNGGFFGIQFGNTGDVAIAGDFDGDNMTDFGVSRFNTSAGGVDLIYLESSTNTAKFPVWGNAGDIFISGDYDGDKKTDVMAWRPNDGIWYIVNSSGANGGYSFIQHGQNGDKPYAMDFDGDGKSNLAYFRPSTADWVIRDQTLPISTTINFGLAGDIPVPADYDGDNRDDLAVFRDGLWIVLKSSNGQVEFTQFGAAGDIPVPGDYDGDNQNDKAVYRQGIWHLLRSSQGYTGFQFGAPTDTAMPKAYIP